MTPSRESIIHDWLSSILPGDYRLSPLAGDASFRRYLRVSHGDVRYIVMDAPPQHEDVRPFLHVAGLLSRHGVRAPAIVAQNIPDGLLLLEDFGDLTWAEALRQQTALVPLLEDALRQLHNIQSIVVPDDSLPHFDGARLRRECALYTDWFLPRVARIELQEDRREACLNALEQLFAPLLQLPRVVVHLDFHSRNLMVPAQGLPLGVIDFQDALFGPATYDLASLLYDCYQDYPESLRQQWSYSFFSALAVEHQQAFDHCRETWHRLLRLTAMQRHIKAIGIFSRLAYRDNKRQFLNEIPLTARHLCDGLAWFDAEGTLQEFFAPVAALINSK